MIQIGKLRKLAQPYFLPIEETNSWQFLLLIFALIAYVIGSTLLLLTGLISGLSAIAPEIQERFLPGVPANISSLWEAPAGSIAIIFMIGGILCFASSRSKLRDGRWLPWLMLGAILLLILVIN